MAQERNLAMQQRSPLLGGTEAAEQTLTLVLRPEECMRRIMEEVEIRDSLIVRQVSLEFKSTLAAAALVPILRPVRGLLIDDLRIEHPIGTSSTLNRDEAEVVQSQILRAAAEIVLIREGYDAGTVPAQSLLNRISLVPKERSARGLRFVTNLRRLAAGVQIDLREATTPDYLSMLSVISRDSELVELVDFFRVCRLVLFPVPPEGTSKVVFSYRNPVSSSIRPTWRELFRSSLGQSPYDFRFELPLARRTPSYHFRASAPAGHYIRRAEFIATRYTFQESSNDVPKDWELEHFTPKADSLCFIEGEGASSGNLAHLYAANLDKANTLPRRLFARITVNERPAGEIGAAALNALVVLATIATVFSLGSRLIGKVPPSSTDAVAILVTLPGLLTLASHRSAQALAYWPICARVVSVMTIFSSIAGAALFLWWSAIRGGTPGPIPTGVGRSYWVLLATEGSAVLYLLWRLAINGIRFSKLFRSPGYQREASDNV